MTSHSKQIVKVQISLFSSKPGQQILIYNEDNTAWYEGPADKEIIKAMGKEPKKFFYAKVPKKPGIIELLEEAPWQDW